MPIRKISGFLIGASLAWQSSTLQAALATNNQADASVAAQLQIDYEKSLSRQQHLELYQKFAGLPSSPLTEISPANFMPALDVWLEWYAIQEWLFPDYSSAELNRLISLAHRRPITALQELSKLIKLNKGGKTSANSEPQLQAITQLLYGFIATNLDYLLTAANPQDQSASLKAQRYAQARAEEFYTGEICYSLHYKGQAWQALQRQAVSTRIAEAAAYLSMQLRSCGECEGIFDCYLANSLALASNFLQAYPNSELAERVLSRALIQIEAAFVKQRLSHDYLSSHAYYQPQEAANVLVGFENKLQTLPTPLQLRLKRALLPYYLALNQTTNSQRVLTWLKLNASEEEYQKALQLEAASIKPALYLHAPKIISTDQISLNWGWRKTQPAEALQVWRATLPDFSDAVAISGILDVKQNNYVDTTVQAGRAYWYQLRSISEKPLSHTAYGEIANYQQQLKSANLHAWTLDKTRQTLYFKGILRFSEMQMLNVWQGLPLQAKADPATNLPFHIATPSQPIYIDKSGQTFLVDKGAVASPKQLTLSKNQTSKETQLISLGKTPQVWQIKATPAILSADQQQAYSWQNQSGLWLSNLSEGSSKLIVDEKKLNPLPFEAQALFWRGSDQLIIAGTWRDGGKNYLGWRSWSQGQLKDQVSKLSAAYANLDESFAPDISRDGIWLISSDDKAVQLLGWDGQLKQVLQSKEFPGLAYDKIARVLANPVKHEIYFSSSRQIYRLNAKNKLELIWQQENWTATHDLPDSVLQKDIQGLRRQLDQANCQLQAPWLGLKPGSCEN